MKYKEVRLKNIIMIVLAFTMLGLTILSVFAVVVMLHYL